jgi:hypothetical protein
MEDMSTNPHLKEGKYERSCLNFYINHPTWVIPEEIRIFLEKLRLWEQKQQVSPTINSGLFATDLNLMTRSALAHGLYDSYRRQFKGGS